MNKVIIVGGGAAGMLASVVPYAETGCEVLLFEKNEKLGKKVYITRYDVMLQITVIQKNFFRQL